MSTPIRDALVPTSTLRPAVKDGSGAVRASDRGLFEEGVREAFADSLNLDSATAHKHPQENRWDYVLGHRASKAIVAVEPHTANNHEIKTVIAKRRAALEVLRPHFRQGKRVATWLWVTAGRVDFPSVDKARLALDQHGIQFVGRQVLHKHLGHMAK